MPPVERRAVDALGLGDRVTPAADQPALQIGVVGAEPPVRARLRDREAGRAQAARGGVGSLRSERAAEPLVAALVRARIAAIPEEIVPPPALLQLELPALAAHDRGDGPDEDGTLAPAARP